MDHRAKFTVAPFELQPGNEWREPRAVTHVVRLKRTNVKEPRVTNADTGRATANLLGESMTVFRDSAFADDSIYERHSKLSFDVITGLMRDARVLNLEYDDHHLPALPQIFRGLQ
jgi:hypothetical protein